MNIRKASYVIDRDKELVQKQRTKGDIVNSLREIAISQSYDNNHILPGAQTSVRLDISQDPNNKYVEVYIRTCREGKVEEGLIQILDNFNAVLKEGDRNMRTPNEDYSL